MRKPADQTFTSQDVRTMTVDEIQDYWVRRNQYLQKLGRSIYSRLVVPETGEIVASTDAKFIENR